MSKKETIFLSFEELSNLSGTKKEKPKRPRAKVKPINKRFFDPK